MKLLKKLLAIFLLSIVSVTILSTHTKVAAYDTSTLNIHYFRYDDTYTGWSLWLWPYEPIDGGGSDYTFNGEDSFGKTLSLSLEDTPLVDSTSIGILVRTADWVKDVSINRYIDLTNPDEFGTVDVYLVQNDSTVYYALEDADVSNKVLSASFIDEDSVYFVTTKTITADDVTLYADEDEIAISNFAMNGYEGSFDITEEVDLFKSYSLEVDFGDVDLATSAVGFDGFYTSDAFNEAFGYDGDLGAIYSSASTTFKLWAPVSDAVQLNLYTLGHTASQTDYDGIVGVNDPYQVSEMILGDKGVWSVTVLGDLDGIYYTYSVTNGEDENELVDPYAFTVGVNGSRGMVINFDNYNPTDWESDVRPETMVSYTDAIIYELHVRDFTSHSSWNGTEEYRGKFLGLTETGTTYSSVTTGLDHILELGVTHVQLLPVFDHGIIDETRLNDESYYGIYDGIFNWGYMPENFNSLEGSYSTDPYNGEVRTTEFKELVQTFHSNDVRVIMDVVYNHTGKSADSNFDLIIPGYYYRMNSDGTFSNGSGTGNETASERYMFSKYMVDSLKFYANEYHIDGFRFDLMKLHDIETMNVIVEELHAIDDTIIIFGEPWTGGTSQLSQTDAAYNANLDVLPGIAVFNDDTRDGIKGSVFTEGDKGFVQGSNYADSRVMLGVTGGTAQLNLGIGALPKGAWALQPTQTINYVTAHDNNTLYDKLYLSTYAPADQIIRMQRQANAIVLTSQGIPFLHAGVEILRSKPCTVGGDTCNSSNLFDHNSYKSPDETNQIDWNLKVDNIDTFNYYKTLISLRKMKPVFTLSTTAEITQSLTLIPDQESGFISYLLSDSTDQWKTIYVLHNNGDQKRKVTLQLGTWNVVATTDEIGEVTTTSFNDETISTLSTLYVQKGGKTIELDTNETLIMYSLETVTYSAPAETNYLLPIFISVGAVIVLIPTIIIARKKILVK
ncbi:MAG: type I pullulanase [Firmicutes bacterium]|nr:type I pullulanase [Bacillota bacterium]